MDYIQIKPVTISKYPVEVIATYCAVPQLTVNTGSTAFGDVILYSKSMLTIPSSVDEEGNEKTYPDEEVYTRVLTVASAMTDEQYLAWGTDDNYAVNVLIANANLTRV